jgi:GntR family transcriptional regulator
VTSSSVAERLPDAALRSFAVDRSSPVPLYYQVAQHLETAISRGDIPPGTLFTNEVALADELGLSRPTMRRAMQYLVDKGLIVRRRGIGTRVVQPTVRRPLELTSLHDDLARSGQKPTTTVLGLDRVAAEGTVADALRLASGVEVLRIQRLRSADERPIAKLTNYLPPHLADLSREALETHGLYELLRARNVRLHSATQTIGARTATAAEARLLQEPPRAALLTMERVTYDDHGAVVEWGTHLYAASRYAFDINLLSP